MRRALLLLSLPILAGCEPEPVDLTPVTDRLDETDRRLTAAEERLTEIAKTLEPVAEWAKTERERAEKRDEEIAARKAAPRPPMPRRPDGSTDRPDLVDPFGSGGDPAVAAENREAAASIASAIRCEELSESSQRCTIARSELDELLANPALLSRQARVVPSVRDGATAGYKLYGIRPNSIPKALGIKNGDLLQSVNGLELTTIDKAMELYSKLTEATALSFEFERKGSPWTLELEITE